MTAQSFSVPGLFEPDLWRQAGWFTVAYLTPHGLSPTLGLVFRDRDLGAALFTGWHHALGPTDTEELVRVALIESVDGYRVHLSLDGDVVRRRLWDAGAGEEDVAAHVANDAWCTMRGPACASLNRFKDAYQRAGRYALAPAALDRSGGVEWLSHLTVAKRRLVLRRADEVGGAGDPDRGLGSR